MPSRERDPIEPSAPRLHGVALEQYAAVLTWLSEGFPIEVALACEGIDGRRWERAEEAWGDALAADVDREGTLTDALDRGIARARASLTRTVIPFDDDLDAWSALTRHFQESTDPEGVCARAGVTVDDVAWLFERWGERIANDDAIRERWRALLEAPTAELPRARVRTVELPPSRAPSADPLPEEDPRDEDVEEEAPPLFAAMPHLEEKSELVHEAPAVAPEIEVPPSVPSPAVEAPPAAEPVVAPAERTLSLLEYASLCAAIDVSPASTDAAHARFGLSDPSARVAEHAAWEARLRDNPAERRELLRMRETFRRRTVPPSTQPSSSAPASPPASSAAPWSAPASSAPWSAPSSSAPSWSEPSLSLEDYARLCVEVAVFPAQAEETFARYGLADRARRAAVDHMWRTRLARSPAEYDAWSGLCEAHRQALARR